MLAEVEISPITAELWWSAADRFWASYLQSCFSLAPVVATRHASAPHLPPPWSSAWISPTDPQASCPGLVFNLPHHHGLHRGWLWPVSSDMIMTLLPLRIPAWSAQGSVCPYCLLMTHSFLFMTLKTIPFLAIALGLHIFPPSLLLPPSVITELLACCFLCSLSSCSCQVCSSRKAEQHP